MNIAPTLPSVARIAPLVTIFADRFGERINAARVMEFAELERVIRAAPLVTRKDALALLKLARFGEVRTAKKCLRHDANVLEVFGVEGDYDGEEMPMQDAAKALSVAGVAALLYTSPTHTPEFPRWRVIVALSTPLEGSPDQLREQRRHWTGVLNAILGGVLRGESFALSQCFYFGPIEGRPDPEIIRLDGDCIDEIVNPPAPVFPANDGNCRSESKAKSEDGVREDQSKDLLARVGRDVRTGNADYEIHAAHAQHPHVLRQADGDRAIQRAIDKAREDWAREKANRANGSSSANDASNDIGGKEERIEPEGAPIAFEREKADANRKVIRLQAGHLHNYADDAEQSIGDSVYVRGQQLVRVAMAPELSRAAKKLVKRSGEQRVISAVNAEYLRRRLNTVVAFHKFSRQRAQWEPTDCPADLAKNILLAGDWQHFQPLEAIATAPFLRSDLTVCDTLGYDAASRVFYAPNAQFPPISAKPSKDDAKAALARLAEPFKQFPYAGVSEAAFLSHVLAAVGRHAIDTVPIFVYTAPLVASGKTLLASMANRIADGVEPGVHPYTDESEEIRKVLMSALLAGDSTVLLDNVPNGSKVRSPILCAFVTAAVYTDRKLGVSESPNLPNRCGVLLTGNNITPAGDLARRCLIVRLDIDAETARGREFEIPNLKDYVTANRPQLIVDALTVILAFASSSDTWCIPKPLESFERYSRIARDPLVWLGKGDAVETQQLETEDELAPLREAFEKLTTWPDFAIGKEFSARQLAKVCESYLGEDLRAAIEAAGCSDAASALKVGYWLREHRDRVASVQKLTATGTTGGVARWKFRNSDR